MEESQEILLNSLQNSRVSVPPEVSSIRDLTPTTLVSICAQSLNLIDRTASFPTSLPDSMARQFKICSDMASAIQNLGFIGDMSFHKFLYPSEEDLYKLVRFFVERLSESSKDDKSGHSKDENARRKIKGGDKSTSEECIEEADNEEVDLYCQKVEDILNDLRLKTEVPKVSSIKTEDPFISELNKNHCIPQKIEVASGDLITSGSDFSNDEITGTESSKGQNKLGNLRNDASENEANKNDKHISLLEQKVTSVSEQSSKMNFGINALRDQEKVLMEKVAAESSEVQHLEIELQLWKEAVSMTFDDQHPIDYYTERLNEQVDARKHSIEELESQWDTFRKPLEEKRRSLEETLYSTIPGSQEKLQKLKQVDLEVNSILSEIRKRDEEYEKLTADLKKQPKVASRRSHIQRITEITKNSRKQEGDIEQILKETRELQLESNSIQERLHRSYAVLDEIVFREAKKDSVGRQAYRLLTSIHESFEQISEKILATDRIRREVAEHEKKLTTMAARSLNLDKLQADLQSIRQENEFLEEQQRRS